MKLKKILSDLYAEIKHGDDEHQLWLKNKIDEFYKEFEKQELEKAIAFNGSQQIPYACKRYLSDAFLTFQTTEGKINVLVNTVVAFL